MPKITFGGMASGLPPNIVDQLIEAERIPIQNIESKKAKSEARLKLVNDLESKVMKVKDSIGTLASNRGFQDVKLTSGNENVVQGVVDPQTASPGSWNIEVVELPQKAAAVTNGFPDRDRTEIGVGYFKFDTPDGAKEVYIGGKNNTLDGAAAAINSAGLGVKATVINDRSDTDFPFKLMISGDDVGGENQISYPTLYFLDGDQDLYFDSQKEAKNGIIKVDGFEMGISSTSLKDVIPGVTLELKQAAPGQSVNVSVKEDLEVVSGKIKEFVDAVNGVLGFIQQQNTMDANTDTTQTLGGDGLLRSIESRFRRLVQDPQYGVSGSINRLNQLGIQFNRNGTLELDEDKFNATLAKDPNAVQGFFAGDGFDVGFIPSLKREVGNILNQAFGPVAVRKRGLRDKIKRFDESIESKERQLARKEQSLRRKFANLEQTISGLKQQGSAISSVAGGGGGMMQMMGG